MVVEAGVVLGGPAQQPDVDVGVAVQRDVDPVVVVEGQVVLPQLGLQGQRRRERAQLGLVEVAVRQRLEGQVALEGRGLAGGYADAVMLMPQPPCLGAVMRDPVGERPSARRGLSTRTAWVAASPSSTAGFGVRPVGAEHEDVDPEDPGEGVERLRP